MEETQNQRKVIKRQLEENLKSGKIKLESVEKFVDLNSKLINKSVRRAT